MLIRFPVISQYFKLSSVMLILFFFIISYASLLITMAPAYAAANPSPVAVTVAPGPDYWVRSSPGLVYTDDTGTITWKGPEADNVSLSYIIDGKEYFIARARGDRNYYYWNVPDQPDPSHPSSMVFRYVRIKAVWQKRITNSVGKTTFQNLTTQYSDYFTIARPGAFLITTQALPTAYAREAYSYTLHATGGETPYHWYVKAGYHLPSGLTLSDDGRITGTPAAYSSMPANIRFCVQDSGVDALHDEVDLALSVWDRTATGTPRPEEPFDFMLEVSDYSDATTIDRPATGQATAHKTLNVRWSGGVPRSVTLSVTGCPTGLDCSFSPRTGSPFFSSAMNISAHNTLAPGTYPIVIHATTETGMERTLTYTVTVVTSENTTGDLILEQSYDLEDGFYSDAAIMPIQVNDGLGWAIKDKNTIFKTIISSTFNTDMDVLVELWLPTEDWTWEGQTPVSGSSIRTSGMGTYNCPEHYVYGTTVTVPAHGEVEIILPDPAALSNETVHSSPHRIYDEYTILNAPRPSHAGDDRVEAPEYTVVVDPGNRVTESNEFNNFPNPRGYESVYTRDSATLNILYTPFISDNYDVDDFWPGGVHGASFARDWSDNMTGEAQNNTEFMIGVYPVADEGKLSYYLNPGLVTGHAWGSNGDREQLHLQEDLADMAAENGYDRIVALVPYGWYTDSPNWGGIVWNHNSRACFVRINKDYLSTVTHENYHNLGHDDIDHFNSTHDFPADDGYWINERRLMDVSAGDIRDYMDYTSQPRWTTVARYYSVNDGLPHSDDPPVLLFRCLLNKNGSIELKPFMIVDGRPDVEPVEWSHKIVLKDSGGNVVREQKVYASFTASLDIMSDTVTGVEKVIDETFISSTVLWSDDVARVELRDKSGTLLASRDVSRNPPTVQFTEPRAGDVWEAGKAYKLKWNASDPDGNALSYSLAVSPDKATWVPVAIDLKSTEYEVDTGSLQPGDYYFRIRATDGVLSANDTMVQSIRIKGESALPSQSGTATTAPASGQSGLPGTAVLIGAGVVVATLVVIAGMFLIMRTKK